MRSYSRGFNITLIFVLVLAGFGAGLAVGYRQIPSLDKVVGISNKDNVAITSQVDFDPFWKTWLLLSQRYVSANVSSTTPAQENLFTQKLVWGAISGMVAAVGDPYTMFLPPAENEIFKSDIAGSFEGVGMEIGLRDGVLTVIAPLKGSPSEKAGMKAGDKIIEINATSTQGISVEEAITQIRGEKGTSVKLTVLRKDVEDPIVISVTRDTIDLPVIETETKNVAKGKVFIIRLYSFSANSPTLFRNALQEFVNAKTDKLIIDLRGNPGGYLEAAVDMASWFLPEGKTIVREYYGEDKAEEVHRSSGYDIFTPELKLVILVNGGSASASEIFAGALREHDKAQLVGEKTYGKGSVQELLDVTPETALKVTVARWLTPLGHSISQTGIAPDVEVKFTKEDAEAKRDPQELKAIELLTN